MALYYQNNEQSNGNSRDPFRSTSGQSLPPDRMNNFDDEDSNGSRRIMPSGLGVAANNFLRFCSAVSVLAAVSIGLILILQILCLASITQFSGPRGCYLFVYRLYGIIFAVVAFCCEMEWTEIIRTTTLLQYWSTRGLFYIFIALFTLQEYAELQWSFPVLQNVVASVGFSLLILGCIYTLMVTLLIHADSCETSSL